MWLIVGKRNLNNQRIGAGGQGSQEVGLRGFHCLLSTGV